MIMRKKILIIEDDPVCVHLLRSRLRANGYEVLVATDGLAGYELAKTTHPDLITLDIVLPFLNGYSLCGFLKTNAQYCSIPIIMISSQVIDRDRHFWEEARPEVVMPKPVDMGVLLTTIAQYLQPPQASPCFEPR